MVTVSAKPTLPHWLCENILLGTLPWEQGLCQPYSSFNQVYTLHDSHWLGTYQSAENYGETVLCLLWDTLWLPEAVSRQIDRAEPLFLLIKTTKTLGITLSEEASPPSIKQPRRIIKAEHVEVEDQAVLVIDDTQGSTLTIVFSGELHFLAMDREQGLLNLDI